MTAESLPYSPLYIKVWTVLSVVLGLGLLGMFVFGDTLLTAGDSLWSLLRWLASPVI